MKTIKIFVASSEELKPEREMLASLANTLNTALEPRGLHVIVVEWENLDASMGVLHKQEEYNAKLRDCEMCLVLYWSKFGMYTKSELDTAYEELKSGNNPKKLYVYFKNGGKEPADELKEFRDSFPTRYGHFSNQFENVDTLKAHFLTQFIEYQNHLLEGSNIIEVKDGKVVVGGKEYVELANVPFVGNNDEYNDLKEEIAELEEDIQDMDPNSPRYQKKLDKLASKKEELKSCEKNLWDTALTITRLSTLKSSDRLQRAIERFNQGDSKGATAILDEEEIYSDAQRNIDLVKLGREGLQVNIDELLLKIKLLRPSSFDSKEIDSKYDQITNILTKVIEYSSTIYGENSKEVLGHCKRARRLFVRQPKRQLAFLSKALDIAKYIYSEQSKEVISIYEDFAEVYSCQGDTQNYTYYLKLIMELSGSTYGLQSEKYVDAIIAFAEHLDECGDEDLWLDKAISICKNANYTEKIREILFSRLRSAGREDLQKMDALIEELKEISQKEELPQTYMAIADIILWKLPETALNYYEQAIVCANEQNLDINKRSIFVALAHAYEWLNNSDKQIEFLNKALATEYTKDDLIENQSVSSLRWNPPRACEDWAIYREFIWAYEGKRDYTIAIEYANKCLSLAYKNDDKWQIEKSLKELSYLYERLLDFECAAKYMLELIEARQQTDYGWKQRSSYIKLAKLYVRSSQIEKALTLYSTLLDNKNIITDSNDRCKVLEGMALAYFYDGNRLKAEQCYNECVELALADQPNKNWATNLDIDSSNCRIAKAYYDLVWFYSNPLIKEYTKAQEALDKSYAFCRDSRSMSLLDRSFWQGVIYRGMGEYQKAIDIFQQKNRVRRKESLEIERAFTFLEWGKFAEALDIALAVVEKHPDYAYAREVLGRIYKALNEKEKAREEFEACLALMREMHSPNIAIKEIKGLLDTL